MSDDKTRLESCEICGAEISQPVRGRPRSKCSKRCRDIAYLNKMKAIRRADELKTFPGDIAACDICNSSFELKRSNQKFCSAACRLEAAYEKKRRSSTDRSGVWFGECPDCGVMLVAKHPAAIGVKPCRDCRRLRNSAINSRHSHNRRAAGELTMSVQNLADRDGARCNICGKSINMALSGSASMGPTIDHLLPVSMGGTNDSNNLALAHRKCNTMRGNRYPAQMLLEVTDAGSSA